MRVTGKLPAAAYVWVAVAPAAVAPSPKAQAYVSAAPSGSVDPDPLNVAVSPVAPVVKAAVGALFCTVAAVPWLTRSS